jgi:hypothetical protein
MSGSQIALDSSGIRIPPHLLVFPDISEATPIWNWTGMVRQSWATYNVSKVLQKIETISPTIDTISGSD